MAADPGLAAPMTWFTVIWVSGGRSGTVKVCAPDLETALVTVRAEPSLWGVPYEDAIIGSPSWSHGERRRVPRA